MNTMEFLYRYFEKISLVYHLFFITFLSWLVFFRGKEQKVSPIFLQFLGVYVVSYGLVFIFHGDQVINHNPIRK